MDNYFKFWKHLPKLVFGLSFTILLILIIYGYTGTINLIKNINFSSYNGLFQSILIIFLIFMLSSIGIKVQDIMIITINKGFKALCYFHPIQSVINRLKLSELFMTDGQIAMEIFYNNEKDLISFYYFKSWAQPEGLGKVEGLEMQFKKISKHIKQIQNTELLVNLDYYTAVTQEQFRRDSIKDEIKEGYYFLLNIALILIFVTINSFSYFILGISILLFAISNIILLPLIKELRIKSSFYSICGYLDDFTIGESASVVDREPSI